MSTTLGVDCGAYERLLVILPVKIIRSFSKPCVSCGKPIPTSWRQPDRPWECLYCAEKICIWCYGAHTDAAHPSAYTVGPLRRGH